MNDLTLLDGGKEAFPAILAAIEGAKRSIEIHMFIWRDDAIGNRMAEAVLSAADRGVSVRIVKDRYGVVLEKAEESRLSFFHKRQTPIERIKSRALCRLYAKEAGGWRADRESELYRRLVNHPSIELSCPFIADHSKYYLIDGETLFLGGVNIEDKEAGCDLRGRQYGDYMVRLSGRRYVDAFLAAREGKPTTDALSFPHNCKVTGHFGMEEHYLSLIKEAKSELLIVMAYFSPLARFERAILDAHRRGVRVTVMIPAEANFQNDTNRLAAARLFAKSGGRITVLLSPKMLHTKLLMTEKVISLGSTNITKKAFRQLDELNLALPNTDAPLPTAIKESLRRELEAARRVESPRDITYRRLLAFFEGFLV
ncbi:MAG: phosphatidylserine/phosphatidylglycerophosphate/cardiolipin synthase family protein [Clostridia bacterium]|nr:phosphatidylserine/phosphatidylglycerophosphate/cardiolipin synthase family protein [Clostridia bacterium]